MAFNISDYLHTDDLTILLGLIGATVFLLRNLYKPQPLVHPILLGRQSDVARVRNPGESAVYRNYGTGLMGRFPLRPSKEVHVTSDFVKSDADAPRTLWSTKITNPRLQERVAAFGTGLVRLVGLQPHESNVLLALNDGLEFLISDLALAAHSIQSITLSSATLLSPVLETHPPTAIITHADFLPHLLELIYDSNEPQHHTIIVVGEPSPQSLASVASQIRVVTWSDVERDGTRMDKVFSSAPNSSDVFTVSFFESKAGELQGAQLTHENFTAGIAAIRALLPQANGISPLDTIVSGHSLSTAYGRAIAYTALYEGTSFATLASTKMFTDASKMANDVEDVLSANLYPIPPPTILFAKPGHLDALTTAIMKQAERSRLLFPIAWRHKTAALAEGFLTKDSLWDRLLFDGARASIVNEAAGTLRGVVVSNGWEPLRAAAQLRARVALSVPIVNALSHPLVAGPVLASHALDLQTFAGPGSAIAHFGPPTVNVEAKLVGVEDAVVENGGDPEGVLVVRGPPVGKLVGAGKASDGAHGDGDGWVGTGERARVQTNGSFIVVSA